MINNVTEIASLIMKQFVKEGFVAVDATLGNGNDTLLLSDLVGEKGKVYSFDIQQEAVENTKELLKRKAKYFNCKLILSSHENIDLFVKENIDFVIFNLGYLPGSDKRTVTKGITTVSAINKCIDMLNIAGVILICSYLGHEGGKKEYEIIKEELDSKDKKKLNIVNVSYLARKKTSPEIFIIEKIDS